MKKTKTVKTNNFWNTCPRKLDQLPCEACPLGKASLDVKSPNPLPCEWHMASKEHNYCFWRYVNDESLPNGRMPELNQKEVGELLGLCPTTVHFTVKAGKEKLKESELANIVEEYYEDCGGTPSGGVNLDSLLPNTNLFSDE